MFAALVFCTAAGLPGLGPQERRTPMPAADWPWTAVARLQIPGVARCTAFLVAPRLALTAAHCLYNRRTGHFVPPGSVHLLLAYAQGRFARHAVAATYRLAEGYDPRLKPPAFGADIALLSLTGDLIAADAALTLAPADAAPPTPAMLGGYNQDRTEIIEADRHCAITAWLRDAAGRLLLRHDCAGTHGTSGAPLLAPGGPQGWRVAGLQVGAASGTAQGIAVPAETLRRLIAAAR